VPCLSASVLFFPHEDALYQVHVTITFHRYVWTNSSMQGGRLQEFPSPERPPHSTSKPSIRFLSAHRVPILHFPNVRVAKLLCASSVWVRFVSRHNKLVSLQDLPCTAYVISYAHHRSKNVFNVFFIFQMFFIFKNVGKV